MKKPRFSVILPVFNGAEYLRTAVDSVLSQSFGDFEFLICDDGSTDDSYRILTSYSDPRMRILRNEGNEGLFPTLNRLIRESRGELIRLWGQDDRMKPHCLQREHLFWTDHPRIGMSYCQRDTIDEHSNVIATAGEDRTPERISSELAAQISFYHGSMPGNISSVVLDKRAIEEVGLFREDLKVSGDFEMWVRISSRYETGFIQESLVNLRRHERQFSRRNGISITFMRENEAIYDTLFQRLPSSVKPEARRYDLWHRYVIYVNDMMNYLGKGDGRNAGRVYQFLRKRTSVWKAVVRWLVSGNGRWWKPVPQYEHTGKSKKKQSEAAHA
jgi:glycosyltransferase involved in cell wall biosynthesis